MTAPASTRSWPGPYPGLTRPPGTRVDTATMTPSRQCRRTPSITAAPALPEPSASSTMPRAPAATQASIATASAARVCRDDVDPRGALPRSARRGRGELGPVEQSPRRRRCRSDSPAKPSSAVATLRRPNGCSTRPAKHTSTPRSRAAGLAATVERVAQIRRTVGVGRVGAAHGAGEHDRNSPGVGQIQPQRRLLEGVGAVGHDHAFGTAGRRGAGRRADHIPIGRGQLRAVQGQHVDDVDVQARRSTRRRRRVGRRTPSASVVVAIVPPVAMTVRRLMLRSSRTRAGRERGGAGRDGSPHRPVVDDGRSD